MSDTTWRDVSGLTAEQTASMERSEQTLAAHAGHPQVIQTLIDQATYLAQINLTDAMYSDVPVPAGGSIDDEGWTLNLHHGGWNRSVEWARYPEVGQASVAIDGLQTTDGDYSRDISLYAEDCKLTAAQARELAAVLSRAADKLDALQAADDKRQAEETADEAWSAVPVDSTFHPCCRGIGAHAPDCQPPFM